MVNETPADAKVHRGALRVALITALAVAILLTIGTGVFFGAYSAVIVAAVVLAIYAATAFFGHVVPVREGFQGLTAALTTLALLLAAYWYFVDRQGMPKLNIEPQVRAWPVAKGGLIVWVEIKLTNVGRLSLHFDPKDEHNNVRVQVLQVAPLAGAQAKKLLSAMQDINKVNRTQDFDLIRTAQWSSLATFEGPIDSVIEAGETENLYFKAVIPCANNLGSGLI